MVSSLSGFQQLRSCRAWKPEPRKPDHAGNDVTRKRPKHARNGPLQDVLPRRSRRRPEFPRSLQPRPSGPSRLVSVSARRLQQPAAAQQRRPLQRRKKRAPESRRPGFAERPEVENGTERRSAASHPEFDGPVKYRPKPSFPKTSTFEAAR